MKRIYKISLVILISIIMIVPFASFADAQSIDIDYDNCMVVASPSNFYWPFEVVTRHDPAIAQRVTDKHANAPNAQIAIDKPQTDKAEEATWISFKNSANQTANWEVQIDLEYLSESTDNREVLVEMYSNNQRVNDLKLFQDGKEFCIVYNLQVTNPPHEWTDDEIMSVSASLTKDEFSSVQREIAKNNVVIGDASRFDNIQTLVLGGVGVLLVVGSWKARDRIKVELKLVKFEREQLEDARLTLIMNDDYRNLKIKQGLLMMAIEKNRIYGDVIGMVQVALSKGFNQIETAFVPKQDRIDEHLTGPIELTKDTFEKIDIDNPYPSEFPIIDTDPSDSTYIPEPVEYDIADDEENPPAGLKERLSEITSKLPFVGSTEKSFEEYTEDYLYEEIKDYDSTADKVKHLKELWDERIVIANEDPLGIAGREIEVIRKVWQDLLI